MFHKKTQIYFPIDYITVFRNYTLMRAQTKRGQSEETRAHTHTAILPLFTLFYAQHLQRNETVKLGHHRVEHLLLAFVL